MTMQFKLDINQISESRMDDFYRSILYSIHEALNDPEFVQEYQEYKENKGGLKNES